MSAGGTETESVHREPLPKQFGPRKRWWWLRLWVGCILTILAAQKFTAHSFEHGHWTPSGFTEPTAIELLWYRLPLCFLVLLGVVFFVGLRWCVPEKGTRAFIRIFGILLTLLGLVMSLGISLWYHIFVFYMD